MTIGEVARRAGLAPSAVRYYERLGLLPAPERVSGRRRYDEGVLVRLRLIRYAGECGFTLQETRRLFAGRPYSRQLRTLAHAKLAELEQAHERLRVMQALLREALSCECLSLEACGRRLLLPEPRRAGH